MLATLLGAAVVVSLAQEVRGASLAPRDRLSELARLGPKLQGPTLYPAFEPYAKYFLRHGAPDSLTEPFPGSRRFHCAATGSRAVRSGPRTTSSTSPGVREPLPDDRAAPRPRVATARDLPPRLARTLVRGLERSPDPRRRLIGVGAAGGPASSAGTVPAAGRPACGAVRSLARLARRRGARLVAYPRPRPAVLDACHGVPPAAGSGSGREGPDHARRGTARGGARHGRRRDRGDYTVWMASSLGAEVTVSVDGRDVGLRAGRSSPARSSCARRPAPASDRHAIACAAPPRACAPAPRADHD